MVTTVENGDEVQEAVARHVRRGAVRARIVELLLAPVERIGYSSVDNGDDSLRYEVVGVRLWCRHVEVR